MIIESLDSVLLASCCLRRQGHFRLIANLICKCSPPIAFRHSEHQILFLLYYFQNTDSGLKKWYGIILYLLT